MIIKDESQLHIDDVTPQVLKEWDSTWPGRVEEVEFDVDDPEKGPVVARFIVTKPTRLLRRMVLPKAKRDDIDGVEEIYISNCVKAGNFEYITGTDDPNDEDYNPKFDPGLLDGLIEQLVDFNQKAQGRLKKRSTQQAKEPKVSKKGN